MGHLYRRRGETHWAAFSVAREGWVRDANRSELQFPDPHEAALVCFDDWCLYYRLPGGPDHVS